MMYATESPAAESPAAIRQTNTTLEHIARQRIAPWWDRAGIEPSYPATDEDAVALCQSLEYIIDLASLIRFINVGAFQGVSVYYGSRHWSARNVQQLVDFLDHRRAWRPASELHAAKKTAHERALETYRATGKGHEMFADLERFDLRSLLVLMAEADHRQQREELFVAIQLKLESYLIIV